MERPTRSPARVLWLLLAAFDACLLVYLVLSYRWFAHEVPDASNSPGAILARTRMNTLRSPEPSLGARVLRIGEVRSPARQPPGGRFAVTAPPKG
jgi:hypothetical protein